MRNDAILSTKIRLTPGIIAVNMEESVVEVEIEFQWKHLRSSCWKGGQNATHSKTMEFHPTGRTLENPRSRLVPLSSNGINRKDLNRVHIELLLRCALLTPLLSNNLMRLCLLQPLV
ncbi:hypothetical protein Nepgr_010467 [Nepenthes gracilis]|uniref:Uncharacterized protein n=1 Tax=Nepenthes gracilis TaxID=150966 RepID=A0AAD3SDH1_NEPGR|nr:hypothetical protein Nepgr_010467 [Nepenthes gracilis]